MLPHSVFQYQQRTENLIAMLDSAAPEVEMRILSVFANQLAIRSAGMIEYSVIQILSEYGRLNGNQRIGRFVEKTVERNNSLNCEKIKVVLDNFDVTWWPSIQLSCPAEALEAVDSLKTLRDQLAHGRENGTGLNTVKTYYEGAKVFVSRVNDAILP